MPLTNDLCSYPRAKHKGQISAQKDDARAQNNEPGAHGKLRGFFVAIDNLQLR